MSLNYMAIAWWMFNAGFDYLSTELNKLLIKYRFNSFAIAKLNAIIEESKIDMPLIEERSQCNIRSLCKINPNNILSPR